MNFVYLKNNEILISKKSPREMDVKHELLIQFKKIQDAITYVKRFHANKNIIYDATIKKHHHGITMLGRQKMRECKMGNKNPNSNGLSESHKKKISQSIKKRNQGEFHPMYNRRHKSSSKMKISMSMRRLKKRKWVTSPDGKEHLIPADEEIPENWVHGRIRGTGKTGV